MKKLFISILAAFTVILLTGCVLQKEDVSDKNTSEKTDEANPADDQEGQLIGGQKDEHGCLGPAGYSWCEPKQECLRIWETPCLEDSNFDTAPIKQAFISKYPDWEGKDIEITVNKQYGDHASGNVKFSGAEAGGYFFAAKTANGWVIVSDGNGEIRCDEIDPYNFPSDMITECVDTANGTLVDRTKNQ